jgi:hypothetical protein
MALGGGTAQPLEGEAAPRGVAMNRLESNNMAIRVQAISSVDLNFER